MKRGGQAFVPDAGKLDAAPLRELLERRRLAYAGEGCQEDLGTEGLAREMGISSRTVFRLLQSDRVSWLTADRVCVALGTHPAAVFGEAWWQMCEALNGNTQAAYLAQWKRKQAVA